MRVISADFKLNKFAYNLREKGEKMIQKMRFISADSNKIYLHTAVKYQNKIETATT